MYAIIKTGGKQYRVERGQRLLIERLSAEEGAQVSLQPILFRSDEAVLDKAGLEQVTVSARVVEHVRGEKLRVFKFKPKRGYKRRTGHRQDLTRIEVTEIAQTKRSTRRPPDASAKEAAAEAVAGEGSAGTAAPAKPKAKPAGPKAKPAAKPKAKPAGPKARPAGEAKAKPAAGAKAKPAKARKDKDDDGA
jgi:large subunit ribosomal protein L21